jgi:hypothetical protein
MYSRLKRPYMPFLAIIAVLIIIAIAQGLSGHPSITRRWQKVPSRTAQNLLGTSQGVAVLYDLCGSSLSLGATAELYDAGDGGSIAVGAHLCARPVATDTNGELFGVERTGSGFQLLAINPDGSTRWELPVPRGVYVYDLAYKSQDEELLAITGTERSPYQEPSTVPVQNPSVLRLMAQSGVRIGATQLDLGITYSVPKFSNQLSDGSRWVNGGGLAQLLGPDGRVTKPVTTAYDPANLFALPGGGFAKIIHDGGSVSSCKGKEAYYAAFRGRVQLEDKNGHTVAVYAPSGSPPPCAHVEVFPWSKGLLVFESTSDTGRLAALDGQGHELWHVGLPGGSNVEVASDPEGNVLLMRFGAQLDTVVFQLLEPSYGDTSSEVALNLGNITLVNWAPGKEHVYVLGQCSRPCPDPAQLIAIDIPGLNA